MTPFIDNTINLTDLMYLTEDAKIDYNHIVRFPPEVLKKMKEQIDAETVSKIEKAQGRVIYQQLVMGMSTQGRDHADAVIKSWLEDYEKEKDEAILAADDIVKAYNDLLEAQFDKLSKSGVKSYSSYDNAQKSFMQLSSMCAMLTTPEPDGLGMSQADAKKTLIGMYFEQTDDPNKIREIIKARLEYNKATIILLQAMVKQNAKILNLSEKEANMFIQDMDSSDAETRGKAIEMSKKAIAEEMEKNSKKYFKNGYYDYRPLGLGVLYLTEENLGALEAAFRNNRATFIQKLMHYDAVVLGHGDYTNDARDRDIAEFQEKVQKRVEQLQELNKKLNSAKGASFAASIGGGNIKNAEVYAATLEHADRRVKAVGKSCDRAYKLAYKKYAKCVKVTEKKVKSGEITPEEADKLLDQAYKKVEKMAELVDAFNEYREDLVKDVANDMRSHTELKGGVKLDTESFEHRVKQHVDKAETDMKKANAEYEKFVSEFLINDTLSQDISRKWTIQPIKTESGTYTDVNDLVRALYKLGHRKIFMMQCNPGGVPLAPDIRKLDDLHIVMSKTVTLAESVEGSEDLDEFLSEADGLGIFTEACDMLVDADYDLINMCEAVGIDYFDDEYLDECYRDTTRPDFFDNYSLNEGLGNIWHKIVEIVKKVIGAIVNLFKKMIGMVIRFIKWVAGKFKKAGGKLTSKIKIKMALIENAKTIEKEATKPADIAAIATEASNKIAKKIKEAERQQTANMELYHKYATKKASSAGDDTGSKNESIVTLQDMLNM